LRSTTGSRIELWRIEYDRERPHPSLDNNLTPEEFAAQMTNPRRNSISKFRSYLKNLRGFDFDDIDIAIAEAIGSSMRSSLGATRTNCAPHRSALKG